MALKIWLCSTCLIHPKPIVTIDVEPMEIELINGESKELSIDVIVDGISGGSYTITTDDNTKLSIDNNIIIANDNIEDGIVNVIITSVDNEDVSVTIPINLLKSDFDWTYKEYSPDGTKIVINPTFSFTRTESIYVETDNPSSMNVIINGNTLTCTGKHPYTRTNVMMKFQGNISEHTVGTISIDSGGGQFGNIIYTP